MTACQDGFRGASSKQSSDLKAGPWIPRNAWPPTVDRPQHLLPRASYGLNVRRGSPSRRTRENSLCFEHGGCSGLIRWGACQGVRWLVALAADQQLPDDAGVLVGQRNGGQLGWLAPDQLGQPGRGMPSSLAHLLDQRGGASHQDAAQGLVAGARDHPKPRLARRGVILRRQSKPSGKIPRAAERMRLGRSHRRQRTADRAHGWALANPSARFIGFVPGQLLGLDPLKLLL